VNQSQRPRRSLTIPDPWLTDEGDVVLALVVVKMIGWEDVGGKYRLVPGWRGMGRCVWDLIHQGSDGEGWYPQHSLTDYEAGAIIARWLREWLREQRIGVFDYPGCGWNVYKWVPVDEPRGHRRAYLLKDGTWAFVTAADKDRIAVFATEAEALQRAVVAAKGRGESA